MTVVDFVMPSLGADMDAGTVTEWLIAVGDEVERGEIVAVVETDKADIDVEVWQSGVVTEILVEPGASVVIGTPLARVTVGDASPAADGPQPSQEPTRAPPPAPLAVSAPTPPAGTPSGTGELRVPATAIPDDGRASTPLTPATSSSPLARRLAAERGADLGALTGTGPAGAIVARDVPAGAAPDRPPAIETSSATMADDGPQPARDRMRGAIAELMTRSNRDIPHYHLATDVDLEPLLAWLEARNAARPVDERVLPAAALFHAIAATLAAHPELNGFWLGGRFEPGDGIHLGIAISLRDGGLVAPALRDADRRGLDELMAGLQDLVARARRGRLRASEIGGSTITITNLGDRGVERVHGVIHPPQVALIGLGRISRRPAVLGDEIVPRRQITITLAADHRASDGQRGARFLNALARRLARPEEPS